MNPVNKCPLCDEGNLISKEGYTTHTYKDHIVRVKDYWTECDICGSELAAPYHMKKNKEAMRKMKDEIDAE